MHKPTFEDYVEMGRKFKEANKILCDLEMFTSQKVGKSNVNKICDFWRFDRRFQMLRSRMEERMYKDYPDQATLDIFYGKV